MSDNQEQHETFNEYEREPVPQQALLGLKSFVGQYVGEHVAGTELMIGPLFVASGVSAFDLIVGLLLGNLLAVLSWTFLTAPIATRRRLTLYYHLEKVCGRRLVVIYDIANGVMFTLLAGAMITVAATTLGVAFEFRMPGLSDPYPNSVGWVVATLLVGMLFSLLAACGYKSLARFANIAAPWMIVIFLAFGILALGRFRTLAGAEISSASDLWRLANTVIWKGGSPFPGQVKFTLWHVLFFAWFCNMAWHVGMADLSLFRYAKKSWYGVSSAAGMYVGHFMAWICASMLYALQLYEVNLTPAELASLKDAGLLEQFTSHRVLLDAGQIAQLIEKGVLQGPPAVLPGPMTYHVAGIVGLLCVIVAGWTTANPTLYRAGLAFQAIVPKSSRFVVTLLTGAVASVTAVFPLVAMRLLDFVAMWGMVLMPMGAVLFVDFWLGRRLGFQPDYAEESGTSFNVAAGLAWLLAIVFCVGLVVRGGVQIYFVSLPGWFVTALLYIILSKWRQQQSPLALKRERGRE